MKLHQKFLLHGLIGYLFISTFLFLFLFIFVRTILENNIIENFEREFQGLFKSLYWAMQKGSNKEELEELIKGFTTKKYQISLEIISEKSSFLKEKEIIKKEDLLKIRYPIKAQKECLQCHKVKENELLGNIQTTIFLKEDFKRIKKTLLSIFLLLSLLILPGIYLIGWAQGRKISRILSSLKKEIVKASNFDELINTEKLIKTSKLGIFEIDEVIKITEKFLEKVKKIAVDREIFQFELLLLEKFIITSEFVRDWKYYLKILVKQINKIIEVPLVFALFYVDEFFYDFEIFWLASPEEELKRNLESHFKKLIKEQPSFSINYPHLNFKHNIVEEETQLEIKDLNIFQFKTKTLLLSQPKIGGIVGVGISLKEMTPTQEIAIETVLTSLLNVVGSIKAINKYTKELEFYVTRDSLTQLYNQRVFWEFLEYEITRAQRYNYKFALLILDLDNFKMINDLYGHLFGDRFLVEVARLLENLKRKGDILARYGGDEFALILPLCDLTQAVSVAKRINESIDNFRLKAPDGKEIGSTVSIGITIFPDHGKNKNELFSLADTLMYRAKKEGKNRILYPSSEEIISLHKELAETSLLVRKAIEEKKIIPFFQPIYDIKKLELFGCEVLMRLEMENEIIPAQRFVSLTEAMGLMLEMDFINMEKALVLAKETNYQKYLFFNLTPRALIIPEFLSKITALVKKYEFLPEQIIFELTERETVTNLELLKKFIRNLQDLGFHFCIDDFGAGFSSFQYIKHFLINFVKIEGEFIVGLSKHSLIDLAIVESIIALCKNLNIKMIAEFVENEEIVQRLKNIGIELAQGYYLGLPSPNLPKT